MRACKWGFVDVVKMLLVAGADVNAKDKVGRWQCRDQGLVRVADSVVSWGVESVGQWRRDDHRLAG